MTKISKKKIVVIGGGTGVFMLLTGLKNYFENLTAIVTMADDGGSTGMLREDFGILPPGDVRRALVALARSDNQMLSELFNYRFVEGTGLAGHSFGNLMLTALERLTSSFERSIAEASKILNVQGQVVPITLDQAGLCAKLENGQIIKGETNIDTPKHDGRVRIKEIWLEPQTKINPTARRAILEADAIIIGPGDLYTSLLPNVLVRGAKDALRRAKGKIIYMVNVMTKFGETNHFSASDFVRVMENHLGRNVIDYAVVNDQKPSLARLKMYSLEKAEWVRVDNGRFKGKPVLVTANLIRSRGFIRHDPEKTAKLIINLI